MEWMMRRTFWTVGSTADLDSGFGFAAEEMPVRAPVRAAKKIAEEPVAGFAEAMPLARPMAPLAALPDAISFGRRADADIKPMTIVPKSVRGYKLPPSSLLYRSEEHAVVREDALREEARSAGGEVGGVWRRWTGDADQSRAGGDDVRVQAGGGREGARMTGWRMTFAWRWRRSRS
jgi:hypothetical protein